MGHHRQLLTNWQCCLTQYCRLEPWIDNVGLLNTASLRHEDRRTAIGVGKIHLSLRYWKNMKYFPLHNLWSSRTSMAQSGSPDYCKKFEKHCIICEVREYFFFILRDRDLDKNIWTITVTFVMFNIDGPVVYVAYVMWAYIKRNPIPQKI